ncbi:MAG: glycosyltransferase family 2 protein [Gammaproteobacteria bacterium]|nr:glycosyltransferase family 2 protein [Gammaproteobacteria bacterium]
MELSIVIPVFNEHENIGPLLGEIDRAIHPGVVYEVIVVDDGSTDATADILAKLCAVNPRLRVLRHGFNCGQSAALLTGVAVARSPWVMTLDGDGQNDPRDICRLLSVCNQDGFLKLDRLITGLRRRRYDNFIRRTASLMANAIRVRLLRDECPDAGCGLKLFPRDVFLDLPRFDHMHRFLPALFLVNGRRVISVDVSHRPRLHGVSKYGFFDCLRIGIVDMFGVMWLQRRSCRAESREIGP